VTLDIDQAKAIGPSAIADGSGSAVISRTVPASGQGRTLLFQGFDGVSCETTPVLTTTF